MVSRCLVSEESKSSTDLSLSSLITTISGSLELSLPSTSPSSSDIASPPSPVGSDSSTSLAGTCYSDVFAVGQTEPHIRYTSPGEESSHNRDIRDKPAIIIPSKLAHSRLKSPDRFVPARNEYSLLSLKYRLSKHPSVLSPNEKLFRARDQSLDPFASIARAQVGLRRNFVTDRRILPHSLPRHISSEPLTEPIHDSAELINPETGPVWIFEGGQSPLHGPQYAVSDGNGGFLGSGTVAPLHMADFFAKDSSSDNLQRYESRLALALEVDQASKVLSLQYPRFNASPKAHSFPPMKATVSWDDGRWRKNEWSNKIPTKPIEEPTSSVPSTPFRVLDAPLLRDDFYCSTLAYCRRARVLAVGLGHRVYLWSEETRVQHPPLKEYSPSNYVISMAFSSYQGGHSILAVGRHGGQLSLWSTFDPEPLFEINLPSPVSCVCFKDRTTRRKSSRYSRLLVDMDDLVVGDDVGYIWFYSVEWVKSTKRKRYRSNNGAVTLLAKISAHSQQICGMAWSPDGRYLATGGNDNTCLLFDMADLLGKTKSKDGQTSKGRFTQISLRTSGISCIQWLAHSTGVKCPALSQGDLTNHFVTGTEVPQPPRTHRIGVSARTVIVPFNSHKYRFPHAAAVKAIAFAPWQSSLLATGGGTNDRCIRFYHTTSGACLATINVHAQVTSLIWSKTRREIAATFGYAHPEHPYRIAVFSWPSCKQVVAIPWIMGNDRRRFDNDYSADWGRALWAISYPGGPNEARRELREPTSSSRRRFGNNVTSKYDRSETSRREGGTWWSRTAEEGCIIVASSDECVKFHEVWSGSPKNVSGISGLLGGSDILETLEGIEKEKEVIR
ncbi:hypothetical protein FQN57_001316 [Myotisia sp. PD_48]|nr:hypothetical protein FQN57_001316 [Myotisia sp. PD_48]